VSGRPISRSMNSTSRVGCGSSFRQQAVIQGGRIGCERYSGQVFNGRTFR
jgi:hypothetical protein